MTPQIQFMFEGIVALCVSDTNSSGGRRTSFDAGIIKRRSAEDEGEIPFHNYSVEIKKWRNGRIVREDGFPRFYNRVFGSPVPERFELEIEPFQEEGPGIRLQNDGSDKDFNKVVDVEKHLHNRKQVHIEQNVLRTVLRVTGVENGIFEAESIVNASIPIEDEDGGHPGELSGAAESVIARITLPEGGARLFATGVKASHELICHFKSENGVTYEFAIKNNCIVEECINDLHVTDFYNELIGQPRDGTKRRRFKRRNTGSSSTEIGIESFTGSVPCDVINFGLSDGLF